MFSLSDIIKPSSKIKIIDVGASLIEAPPYMPLIERDPAALVAFEPDQAECQRLSEVWGEHHHIINHFVFDGSKKTFYETNWFATGSLFKPNTPLLQQYLNLSELVMPINEHVVETVRLDSVPEAHGADYIKIDVQGGELGIFKNGTKTLETVSFIHTEVSFIELYEDQPLFADVDQFLRSLGFRFIKMLGIGTRNLKPLSWGDNSGGHHWLWTDAVYARDVSSVATMTSEAIEKMAIVAHDLYGLHDLAALLLQHLDQRDQTLNAQDYFQRLVAEGHE